MTDASGESPLAPLAQRAAPPAVLTLPPVHLELTWRPLTRADVPALAALVEAAQVADRTPYRTSEAEVAESLEGDWKNLETDTLGGFDESGELRACAMVEVRPGDARTVRAFLRGTVHPGWRRRGVGRAILRWMEGRGRQMLAASGKDLPARLAVYVDEDATDQRRLYAAAGFSPVRWYTWMRRSLRAPLPSTPVPDGIEIVPWSEELDDAVRLAHNEAFADHWGSEPATPETWRSHRSHHAPGWSFVALDRTRLGVTVAGYLMSSRYDHDFDVIGYTHGYTDLLGVRRPWRGRHLGPALLGRAMTAYRESGMEYATLTVDTANPTGAHGMYTRLGYEPGFGEILYTVEI